MKIIICILLSFVSLDGMAQTHFIVPFDNSAFYFKDFRQMDSVIEILRENPKYTIMLLGHAHHRECGNSQYQQIKLSYDRAEIVRQYFLSRYINPKRITHSTGRGTDDLIDKVNPKLNWRTEIFIQH